ncbi:MAG: hypothetical protein NTX22_10180 [Ignavibacteriales bacterium]|nr:hypothetical protein [Ignavibacteriales bacterium]
MNDNQITRIATGYYSASFFFLMRKIKKDRNIKPKKNEPTIKRLLQMIPLNAKFLSPAETQYIYLYNADNIQKKSIWWLSTRLLIYWG